MNAVDKTAAFRATYAATPAAAGQIEPAPPAETSRSDERPRRPVGAVASRVGLKHLGGYVGQETVVKFAFLRARLKLDNSQLIEQAVAELYEKHRARRAFGDAE